MLSLFGIPWLGTAAIGVAVTALGYGAYVALVTRRQMSAGEYKLVRKSGTDVPPDAHEDIVGPASPRRKRTWRDRVAPLFYEPAPNGKWKISLGRTAFWSTQVTFILMCIVVAVWMSTGLQLTAGMGTLYLGVLSMVFLTNLGLLAYNLGSKFSNPMLNFIDTWKDGEGPTVIPQAPSVKEVAPFNSVDNDDESRTTDSGVTETQPKVGSPPPV